MVAPIGGERQAAPAEAAEAGRAGEAPTARQGGGIDRPGARRGADGGAVRCWDASALVPLRVEEPATASVLDSCRKDAEC